MDAKCSCQFCNGHIAFDSTEAGRTVSCPHCGVETKLFIPHGSLSTPPSLVPPPKSSPPLRIIITSQTLAVFFAFTTLCLTAFIVWEHFGKPGGDTPKGENVSQIDHQTEMQQRQANVDTSKATKNVTAQPPVALHGEILKVLKKEIVVQTFITKPKQQAVVVRRLKENAYMTTDESKKYHDVTEMVNVGNEEVPSKKIILRNYPTNQNPAVGQSVSFQAVCVGTSDYNGDTLELWIFKNY